MRVTHSLVQLHFPEATYKNQIYRTEIFSMEKVTFSFLALLGLVALVFSVPTKLNPFAAPPCDVANCTLPYCLCSAQSAPSDIFGPNIPQIVYLTFDDAITVSNYPFYEEVLFNRTNSNGASISVTFFITHEYTDYSLVHKLWERGHDIALHSITHQPNTQYWSSLNESGWIKEIINQKEQIERFAQLPPGTVKGVRAPFLQIGGNPMYKALSEGGIEWDCSRPTQSQRIPGLWPYTNDYASTQDCQIGPCPDESFPGFWTVPMIDLIGDDSFPCAMVDECTPVPKTADSTYNMLMRNFGDHYTNTNRAPFGIFTHAAYLVGPVDRPEFAERKAGFIRFLDYLDDLPDVFIVGISQALEWMRRPTPVSDIPDFTYWQNDTRTPNCPFPRNCAYRNETSERFMTSCITCPNNYPWLENHLGTFLH